MIWVSVLSVGVLYRNFDPTLIGPSSYSCLEVPERREEETGPWTTFDRRVCVGHPLSNVVRGPVPSFNHRLGPDLKLRGVSDSVGLLRDQTKVRSS